MRDTSGGCQIGCASGHEYNFARREPFKAWRCRLRDRACKCSACSPCLRDRHGRGKGCNFLGLQQLCPDCFGRPRQRQPYGDTRRRNRPCDRQSALASLPPERPWEVSVRRAPLEYLGGDVFDGEAPVIRTRVGARRRRLRSSSPRRQGRQRAHQQLRIPRGLRERSLVIRLGELVAAHRRIAGGDSSHSFGVGRLVAQVLRKPSSASTDAAKREQSSRPRESPEPVRGLRRVGDRPHLKLSRCR